MYGRVAIRLHESCNEMNFDGRIIRGERDFNEKLISHAFFIIITRFENKRREKWINFFFLDFYRSYVIRLSEKIILVSKIINK